MLGGDVRCGVIKGQAAIVKHFGKATPVAPDEQPEILHIELKLRPELVRRLVTIPPFQTIKAFENQQSAAMRCHATPGYIKITQARSHAIQQIRRCRPQINDLRSDPLLSAARVTAFSVIAAISSSGQARNEGSR